MEKVKICLDFSTKRYSDKELNLLAANVGSSLSTSTDFQTLNELGKSILESNTVFGNLLVAMSDPTKQITVQKNEARDDVEAKLKSGGLQVQDLSGGSQLLILKSGYDITSKSAPIGILPVVTNVQAVQGTMNGTFELRWEPLEKAKFYEVRYAPLPITENTVYQTKIFSKCRGNILEGLVSGKQYAVSVSGIGTDLRRNWSNEITTTYAP